MRRTARRCVTLTAVVVAVGVAAALLTWRVPVATSTRLADGPAVPTTTPSPPPRFPEMAGGVSATPQGGTACDGTPISPPHTSDLESVTMAIAAELGVRLSLSWNDDEGGVSTVGTLDDQPAWSTIKVPLALAAVDAGLADKMSRDIQAALRSSDNTAADNLWTALGTDNHDRATAVTAVLRNAGDTGTTVPSTRLYKPYSVVGQTQWTTAAQVGFLNQLPCWTGADRIVANMTAVEPGQRWGLGKLHGAVFKGGWGPTRTGGYTVRQLGWFVDADGARVPLAMAVRASSFAAGTSALTALAQALG